MIIINIILSDQWTRRWTPTATMLLLVVVMSGGVAR
jgi:hypothetical protein